MPYMVTGGDATELPKAFAMMPDEKGNKLFFGLELEVNVTAINGDKGVTVNGVGSNNYGYNSKRSKYDGAIAVHEDFNGHVVLKEEGCCSNGFEIVTIPATLKYHKRVLWNKFFKNSAKLLNKRVRGLGIHIHFSREGVTTEQLAKVIYFIHEPANSSFLHEIAQRPVSSNSNWNRQKKKSYKDGSGKTTIDDAIGTRDAISVSTHYNGKSVELRIFQSIVSRQHVMQCLDFTAAVIEYCGICKNDEAELTDKKFVAWFDNYKTKRKYPYLTRTLANLKLVTPIKKLVLLFAKEAAT